MLELAPTETPPPGLFASMFGLLDACSTPIVGAARPRLLAIPLHDAGGAVIGGLWGVTLFQWLHVQILVVPELMRGSGIGSALMRRAEIEAQRRGCLGVHVDTFSFQAAPFYRRLGFVQFGSLDDFPPGHALLYFRKRLDGPVAAECA